MNVTNIRFSFTLTCQIPFQAHCHFNRLEWAQHLNTKVFVCYFWCSWGSIWVSGVLVGVWGVLPWLFLSLHCTGCESWGSYLTSHKNSGQMTVGLERERDKLKHLKNGSQVRLKNETITPPHSHLWSKLDQRNWADLCESKTWSPTWWIVVRHSYISCYYYIFISVGLSTACTYDH